jgi:hypothetical protein
MTTTCNRVSSGDLITADFMNECVLKRLADLEERLSRMESSAGSGAGDTYTTVPNVIGKGVQEAASMLYVAGLKVGKLSDDKKKSITANQLDAPDWKVSATDPQVGATVSIGSEVDLVFSYSGSSSSPSISSVIPDPILISADTTSIELKINGNNFEATKSLNKVNVGPLQATVMSASITQINAKVDIPPYFLDLIVTIVSAGSSQINVIVSTRAGDCEKSVNISYGAQSGWHYTPPELKRFVDYSGNSVFNPSGPIETQWLLNDDHKVFIKAGDTEINPGDLLVIQGKHFSRNIADNTVNMMIFDKPVSLPILMQSDDGECITVRMPDVAVDRANKKMTVMTAEGNEQEFMLSESNLAGDVSFQAVSISRTGVDGVGISAPVRMAAGAAR